MSAAQATVTLAVNSNYRPVYPHAESRVGTAKFRAQTGRFVVRYTVAYGGEILGSTDHHGAWEDHDSARRFAASMGGRMLRAYDAPSPFDRSVQVIEVEPYWYCKGFGRVEACDLAAGDFEVL